MRRRGGGVPGRDPVERFRSFVAIDAVAAPGMTTPHHRWTGALNSKGYGCFSFGGKGKVVLAARWALEYLVGVDVGPRDVVAHRCGLHACVNDDHLELRDGAAHRRLGNSPVALNAQKTHCLNGHPFAGENLLMRVDGRRQCRACRNERPCTAEAERSDAEERGASLVSERSEGASSGQERAS